MAKRQELYMPVIRRGVTWYVEYYVELKGKRTRVRKSRDAKGVDLNSITNIQERERAAANMVQELIAAVRPVAYTNADTLFVEALTNAVQFKRSLKKKSVKTFTQVARWMCEYFEARGWGLLRCRQIRQEHVQAWFDHMLVKLKVNNNTYNSRKNNLRSLFSELVKRGYLADNYVKAVQNLPRVDPIRRPLTAEEKRVIYRAVMDDRALKLAWMLLGYMAIRPGEMRDLRVGSIDLKRGIVSFPGSTSKNNRASTVTIPGALIEVLAGYDLHKYPPNYYLFGSARGRHNASLLPGPAQIGENTLSAKFRTVVRRLYREGKLHDISGIEFYSLKDTLAIFLLDSGVDVETAMQHFRHHSLSMFQRYVKRLGMVNSKIREMKIDLDFLE